MQPVQKIIVVDGSVFPKQKQSWAVAAAVVESSRHETTVFDVVVTSKDADKKDISVVELLGVLSGTRLARQWGRRNRGEIPLEVVVTDRPAIFSNVEFLIRREGTEAQRLDLRDTLEFFLNDFARAAINDQQERRILLLSRQEAVRRNLLGQHELHHNWTPHNLINQHTRHGLLFDGDVLSNLNKDSAFLRYAVPAPRHQCSWICHSDRKNFVDLTCRPLSLP